MAGPAADNEIEGRRPMTALFLGGVLGSLICAIWYGLVAKP
jgi:hypothetical protein